jgi:2-polyprenyl-6-methoxyphenol hydroxylase-like FAD-dependent oxidoreductase
LLIINAVDYRARVTTRALISGSGLAGPTLAWWLTRFGWSCTIVERFPSLRVGGQNVDIRGAAREVLRRMDLDDAVGELGTGEVGTRFVDEHDRSWGEFPLTPSQTDGPTAEREILRGQFAQLLYDRTRDDVEYRFDTTISRVDADSLDGDGVDVELSDGSRDSWDVVVVAEGIGSRTRDALAPAFGHVHRRHLGVSIAYFSVPREPGDDQWWRWYNAPGGRAVTLRPDNVGRQRVTLSFRTPAVARDDLSEAEQKRLLQQRFTGAGWETERILAQLPAVEDLYLDDVGQIRADRWTAGRVALLGDAAYCPSPVSGMGTSLALVGAYVLAGELAAHSHHRDAMSCYEQIMRPYVARAQRLPPGAAGVMHPRSRLGVTVLQRSLQLAAAGPLSLLERSLLQPPADRIDLPDYNRLVESG